MQRPVAVPLSPELPVVRPAPPVNPAVLAGTPAMNDYRQCMRDNAAAIARMRAAEDVVRAQNSLKVAREHGVATAYSEERLQRQWQYFKSLGGSGASPEQVTVPEDPCKSALQALQPALAAKEAELAQCLSAEAGKVKLASLSRDVLMTRRYLDLLDRGQAPSEPNKRVTPAEVRALLERQFQDYRRNGGTAVRVEDVREIDNPCLPRVATPSQPLTQTRTRVLTTP